MHHTHTGVFGSVINHVNILKSWNSSIHNCRVFNLKECIHKNTQFAPNKGPSINICFQAKTLKIPEFHNWIHFLKTLNTNNHTCEVYNREVATGNAQLVPNKGLSINACL